MFNVAKNNFLSLSLFSRISNVLHLRFFNILYRYNWLFRLSPAYRRQQEALKVLHGFTDSVIESRRDELANDLFNDNDCEDEDENFGMKKKMALLDILIKSTVNGMPLSNLEIREEVDTFMFEGHDTTASAICFALHHIAQDPRIQEKIVREIHEVIGDDINASVTLRDINELHYLDLVVKETLRLYPSVPLMARNINEDSEVNGKMLPKGVSVVIGTILMGRDPENWEDPLTFKPERFEHDGLREKSNPYNYIPFSAGRSLNI